MRHAPKSAKKEKTERQPGDMKALKMQRALHQVPYGHRSQVKARLDEVEAFSEFPLLDTVQHAIAQDALRGLTDIGPTPIQRLAIPALLGYGDKKGRRSQQVSSSSGKVKQFLLAAETGSGKTLAYAIPTIDAVKRADIEERRMKQEELEETRSKHSNNMFELKPPPLSTEAEGPRPKAIVLLPTAELVEQVGSVFKAMCHEVKLRVKPISAHHSGERIRNELFKNSKNVDILVATPHLLKSIATAEPNILSAVTHLVIDEADSLLDRSFGPLTDAIIDRANPSLTHLILCSATIPRSLDSTLRKHYPDIARLSTPNLHAIPRRVQMSVVDVDKEPYKGNRDLACADTIWSIGKSGSSAEEEDEASDASQAKRIIVFVNEREQATQLSKYLLSKGIDATSLTRDTSKERQAEILGTFTTASPQQSMELFENPAAAARTLANTKVLVMTDIGSRGIDTVAVRNVVLYDVPHTSIDFIHRLGRVGRMGRRGRGYVLVGKTDRKDVVREVREGMFRGQALV